MNDPLGRQARSDAQRVLDGAAQRIATTPMMIDRAIVERLVRALATMAENELPVGCEAAMGVEWTADWRARAQAALRDARVALAVTR